jgi:addiction module RelE/StbE family toxin
MKPIKRDKTFEKHFKQSISSNDKLIKQFKQRLELFIEGELGYPLHDHALTGKFNGKRAFSIAGDIRVIYIELDDLIIFLDIGSHNQVYR